MIRVLGVHEDLEAKRKALEIAMERPVYVVAYPGSVAHDTRFCSPGESDYRVRGRLELMLGQWDMGWCEEAKVYRDGQSRTIPAHTIRKFDLKPATLLYLAFPRRAGEPHDPAVDIQAITGLGTGQGVLVDINDHDNALIPTDLLPFVWMTKTGAGGPKRRMIDFYTSECFLRPSHVEPNWHAGYVAPNHTHKHWRSGVVEEFAYTGSTTIQAPGRYPREGYTAGPGEPWNCMSACVRKPGPCVVCHGASSEWRHLGSVVFGPGGMGSTGLVCKTCLPRTFGQWLQIVSDLDAPAGEVKPKTGDCCDPMRKQVGNGFKTPQLTCPHCGVDQ